MTRFRNTITLFVSTMLLTGGAILAEEGGKGGKPGPPAPPGQAEIDAAVARGVDFLKHEQVNDGSFKRDAGMSGLVLFALAHSGVKADDPTIRRGIRALRARLQRPDTYGSSLTIMALATLDMVGHKKMILRLADLIARGQCENGQWSYQLRAGRSSGDNSNTQFAVLALWYARRAGAKIDPKVFARCRKFFEGSQNEDGGWGYSAKERTKSYGSMVATGLAALVASRSGTESVKLSDPKARKAEEVAKAIAWMTDHFAVNRNPEANFKLGSKMRGIRKEVTDSYWRHYWLWSLERAATLAGLSRLGKHDWYAEGARELLQGQRKDGSWVGSEAPIPATCFALLFLSRSTKRAVATEDAEGSSTTTPVPR